MKKKLALSLSVLMVTGCMATAPTGSSPEGTMGAQRGQAAAPAKSPTELGLVPADAGLKRDEFQVKAQAGGGLAGAVVTVDGQQLTADERGVLQLPAGAGPMLAKVSAPGYVPGTYQLVPGFAVPLVPIDAKRSFVSASTGASVSNSDGSMQVTFSPGALSADAQVSVTRLYYEGFEPGEQLPEYLPVHVVEGDVADPLTASSGPAREARLQDGSPLGTYEYHLDLGGAQLTPGSTVKVRFKAEPKLAEAMQAHFDFFQNEGASRDADGNWWFSMAVPTAPADTTFSVLAAKKTTAGTKKDDPPKPKPKPKPEPKKDEPKKKATPEPPPTPDRTRIDTKLVLHFDSEAEAEAYMKAHGLDGHDVGNKADDMLDKKLGDDVTGIQVHDPDVNSGHCTYIVWDEPTPKPTTKPTTKPTAAPTTAPTTRPTQAPGYPTPQPSPRLTTELWRTGNVTARVTWDSDDDRLAGAAAVGALVSFAHTGTPLRPATSLAWVQPDGYAVAYGAENAPGHATASMTEEPGVFGTSAAYRVDYGVFDLKLVKRRPQVTLAVTAHGAPFGDAASLPTNRGPVAVGSAKAPQFALSLGLDEFNVPFAVAGAAPLGEDGRLDASSATITVNWNGRYALPADVSYSKRIAAHAVYTVNDGEGPADQRPTLAWTSQVSDAVVEFAHDVATSGGKALDALRFTGVDAASTWGLNGATGQVKVTRSANGVTLTGAGSYLVGRQADVEVRLDARLPRVRFNVSGVLEDGMVMTYDLIRSDGVKTRKTMALGRPKSQFEVTIPLEEPQGVPYVHTFQVVGIGGPQAFLVPKDAPGGVFPALQLRRGADPQDFAPLVGNATQAKYRH